ncbi:MAG: FHA domain-containing protein [Lachnospiraceae bacterium]|nr:FHA domain-containing protein [Lachnospiraceae bacterium]
MQVVVRDAYKETYTVTLESYGKDVVSFGRHPESDIVLTSSIVSRVHGCFYRENGAWYIKDLDSTNGIKYNNDRISEMMVSAGDAARITSTGGHGDMVEFRFRLEESRGAYNMDPPIPVEYNAPVFQEPVNNYVRENISQPQGQMVNVPQQEEIQILKEPKKKLGVIPQKYVEREKGEGLLRCPRCGNTEVQIIQETSTSGKDFKGSSACCGWIFFGPIGLLCGNCGKGKQMKTTSYWICNKCGNKFKV